MSFKVKYKFALILAGLDFNFCISEANGYTI